MAATASSRNSSATRWKLAILLVALGGCALLRLAVGSTSLGFPVAEDAAVIWRLRSFRLASGLVVGVALATSGVALQALLRNPLAEPFILGLSGGAAVGVMIEKLLLRSFHGQGAGGLQLLGALHLGPLVGAAAAMVIVYLASRRRGVIDPLGLLLTGVIVSTMSGAIIMLLNYISGPAGLVQDIAYWMMGFISENVGWPLVLVVGAVTALGLALLLCLARAMDAATFSAVEATSLGVNLGALRAVLFITASALAAGAVVLAGPIAFVGLVGPHVGRLLLGPRHGPLLVGAAMLGGMLILLSDSASAAILVGAHQVLGREIGLLPIGIFTAMVGGPVFLSMLRPRLGGGGDG